MGSSLLSNLESISGLSTVASISASFCTSLNSGTVMFILYGVRRVPCTLALILFPEISILTTEPLLAYRRPRGKRLEKSIFESDRSHCSPHQVFPYLAAIHKRFEPKK